MPDLLGVVLCDEDLACDEDLSCSDVGFVAAGVTALSLVAPPVVGSLYPGASTFPGSATFPGGLGLATGSASSLTLTPA